MTQNSYLRNFSAQLSQIGFSAYLTALQAYYNYMSWNLWKLVFPRFQSRSITNRVLSLFERFAAYYTCMTWLSGNSYIQYFNAQVSRIEFLAYFTALTLITTVWVEISENSYLRHFNAQISQIVFLANLISLQAYYNYMSSILIKLVSPRLEFIYITNRVLSLF